jgi:murein L,D-transpeptidase YafK
MIQPYKNTRFSLRRFVLAAICTLVLTTPLIYAAHALSEVTRPMPAETLQTIENPNLVILKTDRIVHLFDGETLVRSYHCDLGSSPVGDKRQIGDEKTPLGRFTIVSKNQESPYRRFLGLDYPHQRAVEAGLSAGLVSDGAARSILNALRESRCPDWSTALGGGIGIHGHRKGSDWTGGCIAVSDSAIDELFDILRIGDRVEILP